MTAENFRLTQTARVARLRVTFCADCEAIFIIADILLFPPMVNLGYMRVLYQKRNGMGTKRMKVRVISAVRGSVIPSICAMLLIVCIIPNGFCCSDEHMPLASDTPIPVTCDCVCSCFAVSANSAAKAAKTSFASSPLRPINADTPVLLLVSDIDHPPNI